MEASWYLPYWSYSQSKQGGKLCENPDENEQKLYKKHPRCQFSQKASRIQIGTERVEHSDHRRIVKEIG